MPSSHTSVADRSLFALSWPIFIDLFLHFSTLLINTFMVGRVSTYDLAAMAAGNQVFDLCITIFSFISVGCSVVIAQYLGARHGDAAKKAIHISIAFNFLLSVGFALFLFFFGYKALEILNVPADLMPIGFSYLHILGFCLIPEALALILAASLRVYGKARAVMFVSLIVNVVTVIGNIIVLYGYFGLPRQGLIGVARTTLAGRLVGVTQLVALLYYGLGIRLHFRGFFQWSRTLLGQILHIGLPSAGENLVWILQYMTAFAFIGLLGEIPLAAQAVYFQIALFMMMFGIAVAIGNEIQVGYLVGEKRFDEAYRRTFHSLRLGLGVTLAVALGFWLFNRPLMDFLSKDAAVVQMVLPLFLLSVLMEPGRTINIIMVSALRATGDARFPLYMGVIFMWGVSIPIGYFLGIKLGMGILGIWIGFFCDEWLRGLANAWRWKSRRWQNKRLAI